MMPFESLVLIGLLAFVEGTILLMILRANRRLDAAEAKADERWRSVFGGQEQSRPVVEAETAEVIAAALSMYAKVPDPVAEAAVALAAQSPIGSGALRVAADIVESDPEMAVNLLTRYVVRAQRRHEGPASGGRVAVVEAKEGGNTHGTVPPKV